MICADDRITLLLCIVNVCAAYVGTNKDSNKNCVLYLGTSKLIIGGPIGESNDDPDEEDALRQANRAMVFKKAAEVIAHVVTHIEESQELCGKSKTDSPNNVMHSFWPP